ncbi:MAG: type IV pili methyl-accepting chemotaxis transducer N-terminal domain-containing protein [Rhodospirillales bacterium]|nr:type IV pili methyl-accepting chemotaxis transducer N-terminal domain-containing protein [Rhodospirillales bacterium]MDH3967828.1 type IV pili methyl-accepting chemotaxis transducer N-terminal domain-containing protein [Rhodospirillales bacterium]
MTKKTAMAVTAFASLVVIGILTTATPASAQGKRFQHVIDIADLQSMLTEKMSKELMLVALEIDPEENLGNLRSTRNLFHRRLSALRNGDVELALPGTLDPAILDDLDKVEELWPSMDTAIKQSLQSEKSTAEAVEVIDELGQPLLSAVDETAAAYQDLSKNSRAIFSILEIALAKAARQRMLTQKMAKEYLMIAYGHDVEANSAALIGSIRDFDRTLKGLIAGDYDLLIMPAPTPQLQRQLRDVDRLWKEFKELMLAAANGAKPTRDAISEVASKNMALLKVTDATVFLYKAM